MDNSDAKYLKRKVKAGSLDVHPTEKALVVNYELEATILGELGDPMLGERKECQKIIRLKSLNSQTDITALAKEVINKCKLIHPSKIPEVEQLLYYLQKRKDHHGKSPQQQQSCSTSDETESNSNRSQSASLHRYSPITTEDPGKLQSLANINDVEDYIELLYEDLPSKVKGSDLLLQLARNPDNLEELSLNETLLGAISRVLREEWRSSIELSTNIIYLFFCFSTFSSFHSLVSRYKVGSLVMDILDYELNRHAQMNEELKRIKRSSSGASIEMLEKAEKKFSTLVHKQNQVFRVSVYLLLNLSEDSKTEEKMKKKRIIPMLVILLERDNEELLILVTSFLKKLSVYRENKDEMSEFGVVEKSAVIFHNDELFQNHDLIGALLRLLFNLSFDYELRNKMIRAGLLQRIVSLLSDTRHKHTACCLLYHLSFDDKVKSMFTYTDCIPIVMKMILEADFSTEELEIMALAINLAANKRNAQLICEGQGLRVLFQKAFQHQDNLIIKMIRNISQHDGITKNLFIEFVGDIADAVGRATSEEFVVECLGILGNLTIPDLDYERILTEYDLVPWMKKKLDSAIKNDAPFMDDDDLILEIIVFIGTCASDASAAYYLSETEDLIHSVIELLKVKQEDDEMVLQVVYIFYQLCTHEKTRSFIISQTEAVAYLIDLMHDKNAEIQRVCDATLDIISDIDENWADKVKKEKFRFHNAQWLEIIQIQEVEEENDSRHNPLFPENGENGGHTHHDHVDEDDEFEALIVRDTLELDSSDLFLSSGSSEEIQRLNATSSSRPTSSYQRTSTSVGHY
ncbi:kinesin-associated protein 3 [Lepeophtheirus salmonis]|uniref:kinesin-associated protein 3 n=1 Tax=Lepeophtheirus salmonis TaxID=72036 RepID=UPI001AE50A77|nr:kinesin-associated protein 3-like [Lepeophtheirus salmonis]